MTTFDIYFIWDRYEFLMVNDDNILVKYKLNVSSFHNINGCILLVFKWVPDVPSRPIRKVKKKVNLMDGFGGATEKFEVIDEPPKEVSIITIVFSHK